MFSPDFSKKAKTIRDIQNLFALKELSPLELTEDFLLRCEKSPTNAYLTLCSERAKAQAKKAEALLSEMGAGCFEKYPLLGIPIGVKDILTLEGVRTTCASKILDNYVPPYTATALEKLEKAGAIILGKLNMDEFGMGGSNENSAYGPVSHPTHPGFVPGGSSGGSASAVKGDLCWAALGTDTGGSVRLPAHYCGLVGLKPTYGRISRFGQIAYASSLDQIGPMTRTVEDAALLLDIMSGHDPLDSTSAYEAPTQTLKALDEEPDWRSLKIGVPHEYFMGGLDPFVEKAIGSSLEWFEKKGAQLKTISLPFTSHSVAVYYLVAVCEASSNLARYDGIRFGLQPPADSEIEDLDQFYKRVRAQFGTEVKRRIILGTFALSSGYSDAYYKKACQVRRKIKESLDGAFKEVDLIIGPVSPTAAYPIGQKTNDPLQMYLNDIFTVSANLAGLPAISIPCGENPSGLPIGVQLMGAPFSENRLLNISHAFLNRRSE